MKYGWGMNVTQNGWIHGPIYGGHMYGHMDGRMMNGLGIMGDGMLYGTRGLYYSPDGTSTAGAKIFKGTCKWYDIQRGFGFIIPVCFCCHVSIPARILDQINVCLDYEFCVQRQLWE